MQYEKLIRTARGNVDAWNIAWFEIRRRLIHSSHSTVNDIKQKFIDVTKDKNAPNFFRFVYLRVYLNTVKQYFPLD